MYACEQLTHLCHAAFCLVVRRARRLQEAEAGALFISNHAALRQYEARCRAIADQERQLEAVEGQRQLARDTIDDLAVSAGAGGGGRWLAAAAAAAVGVTEGGAAGWGDTRQAGGGPRALALILWPP